MVEITTETENALVDLAENNDVEKDVVVEKFKEKYKEVKERADNVDEDYLEKLALRATRTAELASNRVPTDAVQMLTIGGSIRNWSNGDTFVGKALVDLEPNTDDGKTFLSTIIIDEGDENLGKIQEAFAEVGNIVTGQFSVSEAHTDQFRVLNSSEDTEIEFEKPDDRAPMIQEIRDAVPETDIESITENMTQTERDEETGNLYPASFGVDVRRMTVDIYDGYKNPEEGNGTYTVRDDTVFDEEDIADSSVFDQEQAGENATPGLTAWTEPSMMEYASGSVVEMIGTVTKNDDGIVAMNVDGIIPILDEGEYDGYTDESSETQAPERGESSGNVDRTTI